ncbi:hypothetical protein JBE38_05505 [Pseudomonas sp. ICBG1301]|uniref:hypothetical protein n=1 Tax=Pseudomonas sp. ICBG1301 TaxID=2795987 RepID=UPI001964DB7A|nr:hypothetical protein [Pseudomonas sp. ICBG1301]MBM9485359.1 hypothetical protein [Pseudomonas sp. ICBG1301]
MASLKETIRKVTQASGWMIGHVKTPDGKIPYRTNQVYRVESANTLRIYSREESNGAPDDISAIEVTFQDKNVQSGTYDIDSIAVTAAYLPFRSEAQYAESGTVTIERFEDEVLLGQIQFVTADYATRVVFIMQGING